MLYTRSARRLTFAPSTTPSIAGGHDHPGVPREPVAGQLRLHDLRQHAAQRARRVEPAGEGHPLDPHAEWRRLDGEQRRVRKVTEER